jgi:hypothetical protein
MKRCASGQRVPAAKKNSKFATYTSAMVLSSLQQSRPGSEEHHPILMSLLAAHTHGAPPTGML